MPAKAGIQGKRRGVEKFLDTRFRGNDGRVIGF
jgi:hypothetical protein